MIDIEDLKVGLMWYEDGLNVSKAVEAFERRFGCKPDTVYHSVKNSEEGFGHLKSVVSDNRLENEYLLTKEVK